MKLSGATAEGNGSSETDTIASISACSFAWSCDFDDISSSETVVSSDWIRKLYSRELCLFESAANRVRYLDERQFQIQWAYYFSNKVFFCSAERSSCLGTSVW